MGRAAIGDSTLLGRGALVVSEGAAVVIVVMFSALGAVAVEGERLSNKV